MAVSWSTARIIPSDWSHSIMTQPVSDVLMRAGLEILGTSAGPISTDAAWKKVILGSVVPTVNESDDLPDQIAVVESEWRRLATEHGVLGPDATFLISLPGVGSTGRPWTIVRLTSTASLAEHLAEHPGQPDFVTAACDEPVVVAVSTEEHGIWLIVEQDG